MIALYVALSLFFFWIVGYVGVRAFRLENSIIFQNDKFSYILIGYPCVLSVVMTIGFVFPIKKVTMVLGVVLLAYVVVRRREMIAAIKGVFLENKIEMVLVLITATVIGWPQIQHNELCFRLAYNNDFAYYLASIDWLKNNAIHNHVDYSLSFPFYSLAEYMIDNTRIGIDITGAILATIFRMQSYEVCSVLFVLACVFIALVTYKVIHTFTGSRYIAGLFSLITALSGNVVILGLEQYFPQLMGSAYLLFSLFAIHMFFTKGSKEWILLGALSMSAVLALYCEFTIYLVSFAFFCLVISLIKREKKLLDVCKMAIITVVLNIFATYRALQFNLEIFTRVKALGASSIDPYAGNVFGLKKVVACLMGMSDKFCMENPIVKNYVSILMMISLLALFIVFFVLCKSEYRRLIIICIGIFLALEFYFMQSQGAYQEFKHVTTAGILGLCFIGIFVADLAKTNNFGIMAKVIALYVLGIFVIGFVPTFRFYNLNQMEINDAYMNIETVVCGFPCVDEIEVDSSVGIMDYMMLVYALKDEPINLNSDSNSYLQYFQVFEDNDPSRYVIYLKDACPAETEEQHSVWQNERYTIMERAFGE